MFLSLFLHINLCTSFTVVVVFTCFNVGKDIRNRYNNDHSIFIYIWQTYEVSKASSAFKLHILYLFMCSLYQNQKCLCCRQNASPVKIQEQEFLLLFFLQYFVEYAIFPKTVCVPKYFPKTHVNKLLHMIAYSLLL